MRVAKQVDLASGCTAGTMFPIALPGAGFVGARITERMIASFALPARNLVIRPADQGEEEVVMVFPICLQLHLQLVGRLEQLRLANPLQALESKS